MSWASGKTVLVTGGSQGIGLATARAFEALGATVHITGTRAAASDYDDDLGGLGYIQADFADPASRPRVAEAVGGLDVLVNNAGSGRPDEYTQEGFEAVIDLNLNAVMDLSMRCQPGLAARRGSIVNVGSLASFLALREVPAYTASKAGLLGLTRALADKWAPDGIRVNLVAPGFIRTRMTEPQRRDPAYEARLLKSVPMRAWGEPEHVAEAIVLPRQPRRGLHHRAEHRDRRGPDAAVRVRDRLLTAIDLAATFVLAAECALAAVRIDLDLFGILVLAFVGSVGGGVLRDLILGEHPPAAFRDWRYAALAVAATAGVVAASLLLGPVADLTPPLAVDVFEAVGLALAAVAGARKSLDYGLNAAGVVIIATVNGCGGGILRDVLSARVPHVLHADFYATAALAGAALMVLLVRRFGVGKSLAGALAGVSIFTLRTVALLGEWRLPHLR